MKRLLIICGCLGLAAMLTACAGIPQNPVYHLTQAGIGAHIDAVDETGSPSMTAGLYTGTAQVTPTETRDGELLQSSWTQPDGLEVTDAYSTCSVNTSDVMAELGFGGGAVIHFTATGMPAPESCLAIAQQLNGLSPAEVGPAP